MSDHIARTIADLKDRLQEAQARLDQAAAEVSQVKLMINGLSALEGLSPPYALDEIGSIAPTKVATVTAPAIRPDEFFNKPLATSAKRVLDLRKDADQGPADIAEIYRGLKSGGFAFDTKNEDLAIKGIAVSIGKNSSVFVKLPSGKIGLVEWYPSPSRGRRREKPQVLQDVDQLHQQIADGPSEVDGEGEVQDQGDPA